MYLAYKYVAMAVMLAEANFNAERLSLPIKRPITQNALGSRLVAPPGILQFGGFLGRVDADGYMFSWGGERGYRHIAKLDRDGYAAYPYGWLPMAERNERLSHEKSLISTNEAYQLAAGWLKAIDVDVQRLEKAHRVEVRQRRFWGEGNPAPQVLLPISKSPGVDRK